MIKKFIYAFLLLNCFSVINCSPNLKIYITDENDLSFYEIGTRFKINDQLVEVVEPAEEISYIFEVEGEVTPPKKIGLDIMLHKTEIATEFDLFSETEITTTKVINTVFLKEITCILVPKIISSLKPTHDLDNNGQRQSISNSSLSKKNNGDLEPDNGSWLLGNLGGRPNFNPESTVNNNSRRNSSTNNQTKEVVNSQEISNSSFSWQRKSSSNNSQNQSPLESNTDAKSKKSAGMDRTLTLDNFFKK